MFSLGKNGMVPVFNMNFVTMNLKRISYFIYFLAEMQKITFVWYFSPITSFYLYRYSEVHRSGAIPFIQMTLDELRD